MIALPWYAPLSVPVLIAFAGLAIAYFYGRNFNEKGRGDGASGPLSAADAGLDAGSYAADGGSSCSTDG